MKGLPALRPAICRAGFVRRAPMAPVAQPLCARAPYPRPAGRQPGRQHLLRFCLTLRGHHAFQPPRQDKAAHRGLQRNGHPRRRTRGHRLDHRPQPTRPRMRAQEDSRTATSSRCSGDLGSSPYPPVALSTWRYFLWNSRPSLQVCSIEGEVHYSSPPSGRTRSVSCPHSSLRPCGGLRWRGCARWPSRGVRCRSAAGRRPRRRWCRGHGVGPGSSSGRGRVRRTGPRWLARRSAGDGVDCLDGGRSSCVPADCEAIERARDGLPDDLPQPVETDDVRRHFAVTVAPCPRSR